MSNILRRPMFRRGGAVNSSGQGITSGLDTPKRGLVDEPGKYSQPSSIDQAISLLQARKLSEQSILKASDRPKGVLVKYRELLGTARKDQRTLYNLEINYRKLLLEKARTEVKGFIK